jgi:methionyl-tRNA formyltransferase
MLEPLRLVMMGTGPFAAPTFRALCQSRHAMVLLVTQPIRPVPGRKPPAESPLRVIARERAVPIYDPESVNTVEAQTELARHRPDLLIVADYGQILAPATLGVAPRGGVNLHGSLLPKYRGAAPINWAIYHGERETGVTVIHMTPRIDAGPCLAQAATAIGPEETAVELETRLAELGAPLILRTIDDLLAGRVSPISQDKSKTTRAPRLKKSDGQVDWSRGAQAIKDQVRALEPWPKTFTLWPRAGHDPLRLILGRVEVLDEPADAAPGTIVRSRAGELVAATGRGLLKIDAIQPAGKRMLTAEEFLRGYPLVVGERLAGQE